MIRWIATMVAGLLFVASASAQPPRPPQGPGGFGGPGGDRQQTSVDPAALTTTAVERMLSLDADGNGKLSAAEVTDARLQSITARADANKDKVVTKEELTKFFTQEAATLAAAARNRPSRGPGGSPPGTPPRRP